MDATAQLMSTESTNHQTEPQATAGEQLQSCRIPSGQILTGRILSGLVIAFLFLDGVMKLVKPAPVVQTMLQLGYPESATFGIGVLLILCTFLYLIPRTALFGAVLLTGYLGGAIATNVRVGAPLFNIFFPALLGCVVWGGLTLRDRRLRSALA